MKIKKNYLIGSIVIGLMLVMVVFWIGKVTFSKSDESNQLVISCPEKISGGDKITCEVYADIVETTVLSINANYNLDDKITYSNFEIDNNSNLELYASSENGFVVVSMDGITEDTLIGFLELDIADDVLPTTNYKIEFTNVEYSDDKYEMISLENASTSVRTKNNIATLDNIILDKYNLNETFDKDVLSYTANVPSSVEEVIIGYVKTDINSSVSGTGTVGEKLKLHYGTNNFLFNVLSEDGSEGTTYLLAVYRDYEFETDVYKTYDTGIYVGNDSDEVVINNLGSLEDNLIYRIIDNKLEIKYGEEVIKSFDILRFDSEYYISDKYIYINRDLTYAQLIDKIKSDKLSIKIVDAQDQEVSSAGMVLNEGNKLYIYNLDEKIDTYNFKIEHLSFDESLVIDNNKKIIMKISAGTTYNDLFSKIETNKDIDIISNDGNEINKSSKIKTGDKIVIHLSGNDITYKLSVLGDVTGDGIIEINDVGRLYRYYNGRVEHLNLHYSNESDDEEFILAGDVVVDGIIEINDVGRLYRYFNGRVNELEVRK